MLAVTHFLLFLLLLFRLSAATLKTPTGEESLSWKTVSNARVSPDGQMIAYQVQETDWKQNEFRSQIWIVRTGTRETYALTAGEKSSTNPEWSPDGKHVAFLSDRSGKQQLYIISPSGGEAIAVTKSEGGVTGFHWSPDGSRIAFLTPEPESKERKDRKEKYGDLEIVEQDFTMSHLWSTAAAADASAERLTEGDAFSVSAFSWSPDGTRIAFSAAKDPGPGSSGSSDIYLITVNDRKSLRKWIGTKGPDNNPVWSPDGASIAFETAAGDDGQNYFRNSRIAIAKVGEGEGKPEVITAGFDENPRLIEWGPNGVYFSAAQKTALHLFLADPVRRTFQRLNAKQDAILQGVSFTRDYAHAAAVCSAPNRLGEVCFGPLAGGFPPALLTTMNDQLSGFELAARETIRWKSRDGVPIEGVLLKPAGFDPKRKYPLLVVIHGGPTGVDRPDIQPDRYYPVERFAAKGALVLRPNYRGSAGYGEKFRSLNVRNLGLGDYDDVITGVDHLIAQGVVDRDRVGSMGWSQGGYISAFITTYSDRFKAVSVGAGISDWMTYYVNTDIHPFTRQYLKATPWEDEEIYRKTSPITYINKARTPTLIQHGELDKRVPIPNGYELYQALKDRGIPVRMVVYKGFGHGINKPKQQLHLQEQNFDWFSQWVWGEQK
jgi:dipeptidyl aminopeptidase/acylaminoacyl peptidase